MNTTATINMNRSQCAGGCEHTRGKCAGLGISLLGAGILLLMENAGWLGGMRAVQFWPALFSIMAIRWMLVARTHVGRALSFLVAGAGVLGVLHNVGVMFVPWNFVWPVLVMLAGGGILALVARAPGRGVDTCQFDELEDSPSVIKKRSSCSDEKDKWGTGEFAGGAIQVSFGAQELDLSDASMRGDEARLQIRIFMGAVKLRVPLGWDVRVEGKPFMGEISNKTRSKSNKTGENNPVLVVKADVRQGALEILD